MINFNKALPPTNTRKADDNLNINTSSLRAVSQKADTSKVVTNNMGVQNQIPNEDSEQKDKSDNHLWSGVLTAFG